MTIRRRWLGGVLSLLVAGSMIAGCSPSKTSADGPVDSSITSHTSAPVTVAPITSAKAPGVDEVDDAQGADDSQTVTPTSSSTPQVPSATITADPALGTTNIGPVDPVSITAQGGTISWLNFTNPEGEDVKGSLSDDDTTWTLGEPLGFGKTYTVSGVAVNASGAQTSISGTYTTATTKQPITTQISPGDGAVRGIAMPVTIRFGIEPEDKALIEKHVKIVTDPPVEGAWAWIQHTDQPYPALDWRPKKYWPAGTKVHVESNIYGLKFQDGWYGGDDVSVDFTIGRSQIVKANAKTQKVTIYRDGKKIATYSGSFGRGDRVGDPNLVTRSGIHVVTSKHPTYKMSNPKYGYEDVKEYWAVRISNNGEFIHNNPGTSQWALENQNISHGCINLSWDAAKSYFESAMIGDPVEISGSSIQLSKADGDIYDWTIPWKKWVTMSALDGGNVTNGADGDETAEDAGGADGTGAADGTGSSSGA